MGMSWIWTSNIAKSITERPRTRRFWNVFFALMVSIIAVGIFIFIYQVASENITYDSEQTFIEYEDGYFITDVDSFKIPKYEKQDVDIYKFLRTVDPGEKVTLSISKLSGELIRVNFDDEIVYSQKVTEILPAILGWAILGLPMLGLIVFMWISVNIKNPSKKIDRFRRKYLLEFHE